MKKTLLTIILFVLFLTNFSLAAETKEKHEMGFIFNLENLLLDINSYTDGVQSGIGFKYWLMQKLALRALLSVDVQTDRTVDPNVTTTALGVGAAAEFHPSKKEVSPYMGGMISIGILNDTDFEFSFSFGGILGGEVEIKDFKFLSAYAEYLLLFEITPDNFDINIGAGNGAEVGLIFYLNK